MELDADNKPAAAEKNSTVGMNAVDKGKKTTKKWWMTMKFDKYIYKVLKQVHPEISISGKALDMMNKIIISMMLKISEESVKSINLRSGTSAIFERDISASVRKLFPKQMGHHALLKAFNSSLNYCIEELCDTLDQTKI